MLDISLLHYPLSGFASKIYPLDTFAVPFTNGHQTQAKPLVTELSSPHKVDELINVTSVCARSSIHLPTIKELDLKHNVNNENRDVENISGLASHPSHRSQTNSA
jgi:hypothetical protein